MKYNSRKTFESKLPEFSGVKFTIRKMSEGRRIRLRLDLAAEFARLQEIGAEAAAMSGAPESPAVTAKLAALMDDLERLRREQIDPAWVRWGLHSIDGLDIDDDDQPATAESLIELGPPGLFHEILETIQREAGLSETERKNSDSPSTSPAPVDGQMSGSSAVLVGSGGTS